MTEFQKNYYHKVLEKMLTLPMVTVAAINGHAFAGGLMLALAHDYRVMREDRGFLCMNEVDLPGPLTPGMMQLLLAKYPSRTILRDSILQARRFSASEAFSLGLIDATSSEEKLMETSITLAEKWKGKSGMVYGWLKEEMWSEAVKTLRGENLGFVAMFSEAFDAKL